MSRRKLVYKNRKIDRELDLERKLGYTFHTSRESLNIPDKHEFEEDFPHMIPDLLERIDASENFEHEKYLFFKSIAEMGFVVAWYQWFVDANNYTIYYALAYKTDLVLFAQKGCLAGNFWFLPDSQGTGQSDEIWTYLISLTINGDDYYPDTDPMSFSELIADHYPGMSQIQNSDGYFVNHSDLMEFMLLIKDVVRPTKQDFRPTLIAEPGSFGDMFDEDNLPITDGNSGDASSVNWPAGLYDTQYFFNVGHFVPQFLMIDRNLSNYAVKKFGLGILICRVSDEARSAKGNEIVNFTCRNNIVLIPDLLAFGRDDYMCKRYSPSEAYQICNYLKQYADFRDRFWFYIIGQDQFSLIEKGGVNKTNPFKTVVKDPVEIAMTTKYCIAKILYNHSVLEIAAIALSMAAFAGKVAKANEFYIPPSGTSPIGYV